MLPRLMLLLCGLTVATSTPLQAAEPAAKPAAYTLDNGLKLIVQKDNRAPVVVSQIWYRIGSIDETNGTTGVAHVLEHMMFKGTKEVPLGQFSKRVAAAGGRENAFTSRDHTVYHQQLPKDKLELALQLEADRMINLVLDEAEFAKEIKVVMEERRWRTDDKPQARVYEQFMATAFQAHPYRRPIIGWMNDLENLNITDVRDWYQRWYAPNNAVLVVAGDVEPTQVKAQVERLFGKIPQRALPVRKPQTEPEQRGVRRITVKAPGKLSYLIMGYKVPTLRDIDHDIEPYALEILAAVLDGNDSARLTPLVKQEQLAQNAGAGYDSTARGPSLFILDGTPAEGRTPAELEKALRDKVAELIRDGVRADELRRVKAQLTAAKVFQRDSLFYQAMQLGSAEATGYGYAAADRMLERLQAITADQVVAVARKYLLDERLTVAVLDPQPLEAVPERKPPAGLRPGEMR